MASVVGIVNSALLKLGADTITDLTDGSTNANRASGLYEEVRDHLLRSHTWNFAVKRQKLAQSATTPAFEFDYQYPIPEDYLRTVSVAGDDAGAWQPRYKIEYDGTDGNVIRTNATEIWLRYIARVTDPNHMSSDFREGLSLMLAAELAVPIAQSNTLAQLMRDEARRAVRAARSVDGMEDYPERFPDGSWVTERNASDGSWA